MKQTEMLDPRADRSSAWPLSPGVRPIRARWARLSTQLLSSQAYLMGFLYRLAFPLCMADRGAVPPGRRRVGIGIRLPLEAGIMTIPLMALLFVHVLFRLFGTLGAPGKLWADPILQHREPYLKLTFVRSARRFLTLGWSGGAYLLYRPRRRRIAPATRISAVGVGRRGGSPSFFRGRSHLLGLRLGHGPPARSRTIYGIMFLIGDLRLGSRSRLLCAAAVHAAAPVLGSDLEKPSTSAAGVCHAVGLH